MYYTLQALLNQLFFNGSVTPESMEANALAILTLALTCFVAYIPFRVVYCFTNAIIDWRR